MSEFTDLLRMDPSSLTDLLGELSNQQNLINELVQAPLQAIVGEVMGGVWIGDGADAFVQELSEFYLPNMQSIFDTVGEIQANIRKAMEIVETIDSVADGMVGELVEDAFRSIF